MRMRVTVGTVVHAFGRDLVVTRSVLQRAEQNEEELKERRRAAHDEMLRDRVLTPAVQGCLHQDGRTGARCGRPVEGPVLRCAIHPHTTPSGGVHGSSLEMASTGSIRHLAHAAAV